eukprot:scaffold101427_cov38-Tisochrysis_lutea.AAC.2
MQHPPRFAGYPAVPDEAFGWMALCCTRKLPAAGGELSGVRLGTWKDEGPRRSLTSGLVSH